MIKVRKARDADMGIVSPKMSEQTFFLRLKQNGAGPAWTFTQANQPIAIAGLVPDATSGQLDVWLDVKKGLSAKQAAALVRQMLKFAHSMPDYGIVRAAIKDVNKKGQKLALMAGFLPSQHLLDQKNQIRLWVRPDRQSAKY
jgi:hypothetical protein